MTEQQNRSSSSERVPLLQVFQELDNGSPFPVLSFPETGVHFGFVPNIEPDMLEVNDRVVLNHFFMGDPRAAILALVEEVESDAEEGRTLIEVRPLSRVTAFDIVEPSQESELSTTQYDIREEIPPTEAEFTSNQFQTFVRHIYTLHAEVFFGLDEEQLLEQINEDDPPIAESPDQLGRFIDSLSEDLEQYAWAPPIQNMLANLLANPDVKTRTAILHDALHLVEAFVVNNVTPDSLQEVGGQLGQSSPEAESIIHGLDEDDYPPEVWEKIKDLDKKIGFIKQKTDGAAPDHMEKYLELLISIPWHKRTEDPRDISGVRDTLDADHYGLDQVKDRVEEALAVRLLKPDAQTKTLCFVGAPGTGKSSIGKSIARALGRKFVRISLGGIRDEADIRGHRRTYVGAMAGRIVTGLVDAGVRNPVFMLDEVDKLGVSLQGDPESALLEVLDPEQNDEFKDHYVEFPIDLSEAIFITTANELERMQPALRDRMQIMHFAGYSEREKVEIAKSFLIPKQIRGGGLDPENLEDRGYPPFELRISDNAVLRTIRDYTHEAGVRQLERNIGTVVAKLARKLTKGEKLPAVKPITVRNIPKYLGPPHAETVAGDLDNLGPGVGTFLAVAGGQGKIGFIDVVAQERDSRERGRVKRVRGRFPAEESESSTRLAVEYALTRIFDRHDLPAWTGNAHLEVGVGDANAPIDGNSLGVEAYCAIYSEYFGIPIKPRFAVTGGAPPRRNAVITVGGIREKVLGARREELREVAIPAGNRYDLDGLPKSAKREIRVIDVQDMSDEELRRLSLEEKEQFTVYCIGTPEQALVIAFPEHYGLEFFDFTEELEEQTPLDEVELV